MRTSKIDGGLRQLFRANLRQAHWNSVETGGTAQGVPDSEYCFPGGPCGWVEFKQIRGWVVPLRPAQIGWLTRRSRMGGRCWVAVRKEGTLWLVPGSEAAAIREVGMRGITPVGEGGPSEWDWAEIAEQLAAGESNLTRGR